MKMVEVTENSDSDLSNVMKRVEVTENGLVE